MAAEKKNKFEKEGKVRLDKQELIEAGKKILPQYRDNGKEAPAAGTICSHCWKEADDCAYYNLIQGLKHPTEFKMHLERVCATFCMSCANHDLAILLALPVTGMASNIRHPHAANVFWVKPSPELLQKLTADLN